MTEAAGVGPEAAAAVTAPSAGQLLRSAREAAGQHIGAVAVALKVPVRKIEALEAGHLEELPGAVFTRALAGSICRHLKIDPAPILAALPQGAKTYLPEAEPSLEPGGFGPGAVAAHASAWGSWFRSPVALVSIGLVLAAIGVYVFPTKEATVVVPEAPMATEPSRSSPEIAAQSGAVRGQPDSPNAPMALKPTDGPAPPAAGASASRAVAADASVVATGAVSAMAPVVASSAPQGPLQFTAQGSTWVEVTDAKGAVQLRKTLAAGESVGVDGAMPLRVVVGRADATRVTWRGQAVDMGPVSRDNVARFEIK